MDRHQDFAGDTGRSDGPDDAREDDAIDAPPVIGTDERRMHVRAYNHWVSLLRGRAYPPVEDLEPEKIGDFGPHGVLLDFTGGTESPAIAWLGEKLRTECDLPVGVSSIADVPPRSLLSRLTDHHLQIIANRAPIGFEAEFVNARGNNAMYRGILLPFSSDDDTIDFIYGVINWKEVVDEDVAKKLNEEVLKATRATPSRPMVPVWADGPSRFSGQSSQPVSAPRNRDPEPDDAVARDEVSLFTIAWPPRAKPPTRCAAQIAAAVRRSTARSTRPMIFRCSAMSGQTNMKNCSLTAALCARRVRR